MELFNKYTNLLKLRGEKTYAILLEFKVLKLPYFGKEYTTNEVIDYLLAGYVLARYVFKKLNKLKYNNN